MGSKKAHVCMEATAGLFNALFFGGMGRVSLKCHTPTQTAL